jgi:hypothetical protein
MRRTILVFALTGALAFTGSIALAQEKESPAQPGTDLLQDLKLAKIDSAEDYQRFTREAALGITDNLRTIQNLKDKVEDSTKVDKSLHDLKILELEQDNNDLIERLDKSDLVKTTAWTLFKRQFIRDMENLSKALKDITI